MPSQLLGKSEDGLDANDSLIKDDIDFNSVSTEQLIQAIAGLLEDMMHTNLETKLDPGGSRNPTPFHSKKVPPISVEKYLQRFMTFSKCHHNVLIICLIYIDRISETIEDFVLDEFNVLRCVVFVLV